jgi:phosphoglycerol transferase MdoB-like AlkP superfamily enzyme
VRAWSRLDAHAGLVARVLAAGLLYDAVALSWVLLPGWLWLAAAPRRFHAGRIGRACVHAGFGIAVLALLLSAPAEWLFWGEFGSRFNFIAVDYLVYTHEVVANVWESYPAVAPLAAASIGISGGIWWAWRRRLAISCGVPSAGSCRPVALLCAAGVAAIGFLAVGGGPARVSDNRYARELAKNGPYELFSAFRNNGLDYEPFYLSESAGAALVHAHRLLGESGGRFASDDPRELARDSMPSRPEMRANVVLVVVESLSAQFLGAYGSHLGLTPNLDTLAAESRLFTRLYATGNRTVRGLEAIALSLPPTPGHSIVKRPDNGGLFTIGTPFRERGYDVRFLYGGYGFFDNMNAFFGGNGFEIVDRAVLAPDEVTFSNAWGVSDEDLFRRALREADRSAAAGRPFFTLLLTTSNHRPYTYPEGRVSIAPHTGRDGAVQYTDWAIGEFLRASRGRSWFDDTAFVIVADHCASSAGKSEIPVKKYRIPMLIFWPRRLTPGRVDTLASQIDVAPTLLGLLGFEYRSSFFGRDLLEPLEAEPRALLATYQRLALLEGGLLTILSPGRRVEAFRVDLARGTQESAAPEPERVSDTVAYYQAASVAWHEGLLRAPVTRGR